MNCNSSCNRGRPLILPVLHGSPQAVAVISGSPEYPGISGIIRFYQTREGTIVYSEIKGLPESEKPCGGRFFGFHIHEGTSCSGDMNDPFSDAMSHYNPDICAHPYHAGDLPPLMGNSGCALSLFLTGRFTVDEIVGKTVIVHDRPDDFITQPSGNSGTKIACGIVRKG